MLSVVFITASLALSARAILKPLEPSPGLNFIPGGQCSITWTPDNTGKWTHTSVQLMTGSNDAMVHLTTVYSFDGTDATLTTATFTCPDVTPHSDIYFYQFTSDATLADPAEINWTGRFSISNGDLTVGPNTLADGSHWGVGQLVGTAVPAPPTSPEYTGAAPGTPTSTTNDPAGTKTPNTPAANGGNNPGWLDLGGLPASTANANHAMQGAGQNTRTNTAPKSTATRIPNVNDGVDARMTLSAGFVAAAAGAAAVVLAW